MTTINSQHKNLVNTNLDKDPSLIIGFNRALPNTWDCMILILDFFTATTEIECIISRTPRKKEEVWQVEIVVYSISHRDQHILIISLNYGTGWVA